MTVKEAMKLALKSLDDIGEIIEYPDAFVISDSVEEEVIGGGIVAVIKETGEVMTMPEYAHYSETDGREGKRIPIPKD